MSPANAAGSAATARAHLLDLLAPVVEQAGYDLEDITVTSAGRRSVVRVSVDADGGIDLDGVSAVSRAVSAALDAQDDAFAGPYVLEVGSPGVNRPLTEQRHWRRAVGRLVQVQLDGRSVTGRVISVVDTGVTLDVDAAPRERIEVPWSRLGEGRVQVEFNRPAGDEGGATENEED